MTKRFKLITEVVTLHLYYENNCRLPREEYVRDAIDLFYFDPYKYMAIERTYSDCIKLCEITGERPETVLVYRPYLSWESEV